MNTMHRFLVEARERGLSDDQIRQKLSHSGWDQPQIDNFLSGDDLVAPSPGTITDTDKVQSLPDTNQPIAVVQRYSTRGIEYGISFLSLGIGAISLGIVAHHLVNQAFSGDTGSGDMAAMAAAAAFVSLPIFVLLFIRLRRAEKATPALRTDSSRRKWVQLSLIVSFLWGVWALVRYLYDLFAGNDSSFANYCDSAYESCPAQISDGSYMIMQLLHLLITFAIAGGIFAYYWIDEHRKDMS